MRYLTEYYSKACVPQPKPQTNMRVLKDSSHVEGVTRSPSAYRGMQTKSIEELTRIQEGFPYSKVPVLNYTTEAQGEYPPIYFRLLLEYYRRTPQLQAAGRYTLSMTLGHNMVINCDDDEAKQICEDFRIKTSLFRKTQNVFLLSYILGFGIFTRVFKNKQLVNVEDFDSSAIHRVHRDKHGNYKKFIYLLENGEEKELTDMDSYSPVILNPNTREAYGYSFFHALATPRAVRGRYMKPQVEAMWHIENAMNDTFINYASPISWFSFDNPDGGRGLSDEEFNLEAKRLEDIQPGERILTKGAVPKVYTMDVGSGGKFDSYVKHIEKTFLLGTGFPYEILTGDFTSRASSQTTDSLLKESILNYQSIMSDTLVREIFYTLLMNHPSGKWDTDEKLMALNMSVSFNTHVPLKYTPEQVQQRVQAGIWTKQEARDYDKMNGQSLTDDDEIEAERTKLAQDRAELERERLELKKQENIIKTEARKQLEELKKLDD